MERHAGSKLGRDVGDYLLIFAMFFYVFRRNGKTSEAVGSVDTQ